MENSKFENLSPFDLSEVKSYLFLLRSPHLEQKEIADKYFQTNKNNSELFSALNSITDNLDEAEDIRLQALLILKKVFNLGTKTIQYRRSYYNQFDPQPMEVDIDNTSNNTLALPSAEMFQSANRKTLLIDSLPYIDGHLKEDSRTKDECNRLIQEEMNKMIQEGKTLESYRFSSPSFNQVEHLITINPNILSEHERIEKGKKLNIFKNTIKSTFESIPPNKLYDETFLDNYSNEINKSVQQYNIKNLNLELLIKHGPQKWKKYLNGIEIFISQLETEEAELRKQCDEINKNRKFAQVIIF
jgi:hypothetical protein